MNDLQIAIDGDGHKVDYGTVRSAPDQIFAEYQHTQPVAKRAMQTEIAQLQ